MEENIQAYVVPLCTKNVYSEYSLGDTVFSVKIPVKVDVKTGCFATSVNHAIYRTEIEVNGTENKFHIKTIFDTELIIGGSDSNIINSIIYCECIVTHTHIAFLPCCNKRIKMSRSSFISPDVS